VLHEHAGIFDQFNVARVAAKIGAKPAKPVGKVFAFMPCKGGAGATFLATNLAWELAQTRSVLLMDLNLQFGDALAFVHDGKPAATIADVAKDITRLDASLLAASTVHIARNYSILAAPDDIGHSAEVKPEHIDAILNLAASQYDFVLVDLPRSLDTAVIKALDRASRIFPVLQADVPGLRNAVKLIQAFRSLGYGDDRLEVIINRFDKSGEIGLEHMQRALGGVRLNTVPNAYREVISSINHGEVLVQTAHASHVAKRIVELSHELSPRSEETRGFLHRILRRA
jgi:pilus assembly protein CpaE